MHNKRKRENKAGISVRGFQIWVDSNGKTRCYHRRTGTPVDLTRIVLGSPEFFAECARIREHSKITARKTTNSRRKVRSRRVNCVAELLKVVKGRATERPLAPIAPATMVRSPDRGYSLGGPLLQFSPEDFWMGR